ncbi:hypothetical protein BC628DRAFT_89806 [Trametes gibbosa]|nr:hypothetical protein BC628DRAFT_89806 [Trametes gibbosa]
MSNKGEGRRLSGNIPLAYDRQQPGPYSEHSLPTPPVPPAVYPPYYDRFAPEEPTPSPYHEGYTQEYNPKYWRTDPWQESEPVAWPDRREPVREPYNTQWDRPARETPTTRMFEPSATWKQTHTGPLPYPESISQPRERPAERFPEPPLREYRERQLERSRPHDVYSPSQPAPERFRPYTSPMAPASVARNRIPYVTPRSDNNRPPHLEPEWAPEDDDLYADRGEARSKEPLNVFSARSGSQGRVDRRFHSRDSVESANPLIFRILNLYLSSHPYHSWYVSHWGLNPSHRRARNQYLARLRTRLRLALCICTMPQGLLSRELINLRRYSCRHHLVPLASQAIQRLVFRLSLLHCRYLLWLGSLLA